MTFWEWFSERMKLLMLQVPDLKLRPIPSPCDMVHEWISMKYMGAGAGVVVQADPEDYIDVSSAETVAVEYYVHSASGDPQLQFQTATSKNFRGNWLDLLDRPVGLSSGGSGILVFKSSDATPFLSCLRYTLSSTSEWTCALTLRVLKKPAR